MSGEVYQEIVSKMKNVKVENVPRIMIQWLMYPIQRTQSISDLAQPLVDKSRNLLLNLLNNFYQLKYTFLPPKILSTKSVSSDVANININIC